VVDENSPQPENFFTDYEASKSILEKALKTIQHTGIEIVIVNPTRVYGPGVLSDSNGVTRMMQKYAAGKWHIIPGNGKSIGNYVYVEDVVQGHLLAMKKGRPGERYVLGGENLTYDELFGIMGGLTGKKYLMFHLPVPVMEFAAGAMLLLAKVTGIPPLIIPGLVRKYYHNWHVSCAKAMRELNYQPVGFKTGAALTLDWLQNIK
jgi:nucleoside-diphosphate-sugar epimerase